MNKNISVWRGSDTPPTNYHLWIKDDNNIYLYKNDSWEQIQANIEDGSITSDKIAEGVLPLDTRIDGTVSLQGGTDIKNFLKNSGIEIGQVKHYLITADDNDILSNTKYYTIPDKQIGQLCFTAKSVNGGDIAIDTLLNVIVLMVPFQIGVNVGDILRLTKVKSTILKLWLQYYNESVLDSIGKQALTNFIWNMSANTIKNTIVEFYVWSIIPSKTAIAPDKSGFIGTSGFITADDKQQLNKIDTIESTLLNKQDILKSGTSIKTINGESLLGPGDVEVSGGVPIVNSIEELDENAEQGSLTTLAYDKEVQRKVSIQDSYVGNPNQRVITEFNVHAPTSVVTGGQGDHDAVYFIPNGYSLEQAEQEYKLLMLASIPTQELMCFYVNGEIENFTGPLFSAGEIIQENIEETNRVISSWGGIVCLGCVISVDENDMPILGEPRQQLYDDLDAFLAYEEAKLINETTVYLKKKEGWTPLRDVAIVDSEDKLNVDAPQGSLSVVARNKKTEEILSAQDVYYDNPNASTISEISINEPSDNDGFNICLCNRDKAGSIVNKYDYLQIHCISKYIYAIAPSEDVSTIIYDETGIIYDQFSFVNRFIAKLGDVVLCGSYSGEEGDYVHLRELTEEELVSVGNVINFISRKKEDETTLYIKESKGWEKLKNGAELVNNLEDGGVDKALSAEMGKFLNEKIANIVSGTTTDPIKFKGYVDVSNKDGVDKLYELMSVGEACLVAPSLKIPEAGLTEDSYVPWIASAMVEGPLPLSEDLLAISGLDASGIASILAGKGEVKTYFKLDAEHPYWTCPDMLLLAKVKVNVKQFAILVPELEKVQSLIPSSLEMTACIGKVLRWSAGDLLEANRGMFDNIEKSLVKNYPYRYSMDKALTTGVISYTDEQGDSPIGSGGWYTVFVNASADKDSGGAYVVSQTAYGRSGEAYNRVFTRVLFVKNEEIYDKTPWVELSNNNNILPNVNGWLLNPNEQLTTGVYQTCNSGVLNGKFTNNYFTMFVNASTSPNGDGWDAIEQTAYGRNGDEGKIYRRVIFNNKSTGEKQFKEWERLDLRPLDDFAEELETFINENLATKEEVSNKVDKPSRNLLINSNFDDRTEGTLNSAPANWSFVGGGSSSSGSVSTEKYNGYKVIDLRSLGLQQNLNLIEGNTYTVSCMYRSQGTAYINYKNGLSDSISNLVNLTTGSQGLQFASSGPLTKASFTFVAKSDAVFSFYAEGNFSISCIQLEEGDTVTAYKRAEETYATMGEVEQAIEDKVTSTNVTNIVSIAQADYDALETKDETTLYLITE